MHTHTLASFPFQNAIPLLFKRKKRPGVKEDVHLHAERLMSSVSASIRATDGRSTGSLLLRNCYSSPTAGLCLPPSLPLALPPADTQVGDKENSVRWDPLVQNMAVICVFDLWWIIYIELICL